MGRKRNSVTITLATAPRTIAKENAMLRPLVHGRSDSPQAIWASGSTT